MSYTPTFSVASIPEGGARVFKQGPTRIAVFRLPGDAVYAVDGLCPHEGYPLVQGTVKGCLLTCIYHNYKFDLRDGTCVMGDEDLRVYDTRVVEGVVEVDLSPPDPAILLPKLWRSLEDALVHGRQGQMAREVVRLLEVGVSPDEIAFFGAAHDARRGEYGCNHAMAVTRDVAVIARRFEGVQAAQALVQGLDMASFGCLRLPPRPLADPVPPGPAATFGERLRAVVEEERAEEAQALLLGALQHGLGPEVLWPALDRLAADHFADYGHTLIYLNKAHGHLGAVGWLRAAEILPGLVERFVTATREDTLPAWRPWRRRLQALTPSRIAGDRPLPADFEGRVLDGAIDPAMDAVTEALAAGVPSERIAAGLCVAAAERVLRFDDAIDRDPTNQETWLSVTHVQTFANAVRVAIERGAPLELLYQAARMVQFTAVLDLPPERRPDRSPSPGDLGEALLARDGWLAVRRAAAALDRGEPLRTVLEDRAISDAFVLPIVVTHGIKQVVAACEDHRVTGDPRCVLAAVRLLASPIAERQMVRRTEEAIAFVTRGQVPRTLVP